MKFDGMRRVDKIAPTAQGVMCFMDDGTVWIFSGISWKKISEVPQGDGEDEEKSNAIIR